jgi:ketosteroid isomerase-like protein
MKKLLPICCGISICCALVIGQEKISPELASLVAAERAFAKLSVEKGIREAFLTYFADDGINFQPHPVRTKETIQKQPTWGTQPILVDWAPAYADISQAGDLGYTTGPTLISDQSPSKRPSRHGTYFSVWKRQSDGSWKVVVDAGTDGPGGPPSQPNTFDSPPTSLWKKPLKPSGTSRQNLMDVDRDFLKASSKGFVNVYLQYLDDKPRLHRSGRFPIIGKQAIRSFLSEREFELTWQPVSSDISQSEDFGYSYGNYELKYAGTDKVEKGYYVRVWKRDSKGNWKIVLETDNPVPANS